MQSGGEELGGVVGGAGEGEAEGGGEVVAEGEGVGEAGGEAVAGTDGVDEGDAGRVEVEDLVGRTEADGAAALADDGPLGTTAVEFGQGGMQVGIGGDGAAERVA